ncbi:hypothetical protein SAMN05444164_3861 [Bradyrhizobium erythrophlei]|uniref:Homeodomain-like domain-containing protein n=1 Tax=Bradyrhizobium erythrophlei TaxID=1437360 RepID=A0A1H4YAR4_9BRAD|nr:hypothetical protein SAMN05444164_3861 [Bradyrhizobium erythrophlei]
MRRSAEEERKLLEIRKQGKTLREIAQRLGRTEATCEGRLRKFTAARLMAKL